jgi:hypothetical protein
MDWTRRIAGGKVGRDFLVKMQDADGGFFYSVYPRDREYEIDVLPKTAIRRLWPKNVARRPLSPRWRNARRRHGLNRRIRRRSQYG